MDFSKGCGEISRTNSKLRENHFSTTKVNKKISNFKIQL